jgi:alkylation response protein AidB-like acyl-CoA dehydrogenase
MEFLLSSELREYRETLARFFANEAPLKSSPAPKKQETSWNESEINIWNKFSELGAFAASVPVSETGTGLTGSGLGLGLLSASLALEESGKVLFPLPLFENLALALPVLLSLPNNHQILEEFAAGDLRISAPIIIDNETYYSNIELCNALLLNDNSLKKDLSTLEFSHFETFDLIRPLCKLSSKSSPPPEKTVNHTIHHQQAVLISSELIGVGRAVLDLTLDYVKTRKQFDRPIGGFQAIQHKLADIYTELEAAASLVRYAAWAADNSALETDKDRFKDAALAAKGYSSEVIPRLCEVALQLHGGIGFTFEYPLHLFLRRAQFLSAIGGSATECFKNLGETSL